MVTNGKSPSTKLTPYEWQHAISASNLDPVTRGVLWALSLYINKRTGYAFPSLRTLSRASGYSLDAVSRHIKIALSLGWIATDNAGLEGQEWRRSAYIPTIPEGAPRRLETKRKYKGVLTGSTPSTQKGVLPQRQGVLPQRQNTPLEIALEPAPAVACSDSPAASNNRLTIEEQDPPLPPKGGNVRGRVINDKRGIVTPELKAGFELFYEAYPRKQGRQAAIKAWGKLNPDAGTTAEIMRAIEVQKQSEQWQQENGHFIPYPATWLNGRRWEDQLTPPTTRTRRFVV